MNFLKNLVVLMLAALLSACGGGDVAGVGSGGSGLASGNVTGFGSVFIDGVEIEDALALTTIDNGPAGTATAALKLGQGVTADRDSTGAATRIAVEPLVIAPITAISAAQGQFVAAGQTVSVNSAAATATASATATSSPLTVFGGGYLSLADAAVGDWVEVHGNAGRASRVEKRSAAPSVQVRGLIAGLVPQGFAINGLAVSLASATVQPAAASLMNGQAVTVWGPVPTQVNGSATMAATLVKAGRPALPPAGGKAQVSGPVLSIVSAARTLVVDGRQVNYSAAVITPAGATLKAGDYVRVEGTVGADGSVVASAVLLRQGTQGDPLSTVRLSGAISSLYSSTSFVVRNTPVDASAISIATACPQTTLAAGVFVDVTAQLQPGTDVVKATALSCPKQGELPQFASVSYSGVAGSVSTASSSFVLGTTTMRWNERTVFTGITPQTLSGASVIVEGYTDTATGAFIACEIRTPGQRDSDRFGGDRGPGEWSGYDDKFRPGDKPPGAGPGTAR